MDKYLIFLISINMFLFVFHSKIAKFYNLYDEPDKRRKFHKFSTPLSGGLIIFLNLTFYFIYIFSNNYFFSQKIFIQIKLYLF